MESRLDSMNLEGKEMYIFIGPSGSGKSKLGFQLRKFNIPEMISHTSREIRLKDGEKEGETYYYRTKENIRNKKMVEYADYDGELYGLSEDEVVEKFSNHDIVYAVTELNGIKQIKKKLGDRIRINVIFIKIDPEETELRMKLRGDNPEKIESRIAKAIKNKEYDNGKYADFIIDNNGSFENSVIQLFDIVFNQKKKEAVS